MSHILSKLLEKARERFGTFMCAPVIMNACEAEVVGSSPIGAQPFFLCFSALMSYLPIISFISVVSPYCSWCFDGRPAFGLNQSHLKPQSISISQWILIENKLACNLREIKINLHNLSIKFEGKESFFSDQKEEFLLYKKYRSSIFNVFGQRKTVQF